MPSLREQQQRFAATILGTDDAVLPVEFFSVDDAAPRVAIYRNIWLAQACTHTV